MLKTRDDIFTEVLVRNNRSTTDSFITDIMLKSWFFDSVIWASAYHKWPFTEGRLSTTWTGTEEINFEGLKADTLRMIQIGGKRLYKKNFEDYQIFREESPASTQRYFSDYMRTLFVNPYADVSGTLVAYAQYQPYVDVTDETGTTPFSGYDEDGNEAIVEKMSGYLKRREHLVDEAELHDKRAEAKLDIVWGKIQEEQYAYQNVPERGGMFERIDVLDGRRASDEIKRDQF
jgi:hypothetical protein